MQVFIYKKENLMSMGMTIITIMATWFLLGLILKFAAYGADSRRAGNRLESLAWFILSLFVLTGTIHMWSTGGFLAPLM